MQTLAIVYTLTISNSSGVTATGVIVTDTLPAGLTGVSFSPDGVSNDVSGLDDGTLTIEATATDSAGNESSATTTATLDTTAPTAPSVTGPISGTTVLTNTPTVTGVAEPGSTVEMTDENGNVVCTTTADVNGDYSCTTDPLPEGPGILEVVAIDPAGNVSEPTVIDVVIDTGATPLGLIEGITWNDADADGIQDAGEAGLVTASSADAQNALLPGVVVNLLRLVGQASSRCSTATANR